MTSVFSLQAYMQNYDWVKLGLTSKAAVCARVATPGFEIDEETPYAGASHHLILWSTPIHPVSIRSLAD
jgi:hypothetical protein